MRLDKVEQEALRYALEGFEGQVYLFGSRLDDDKRGGDIDILLIPKKRQNSLKLALKVQTRFFSRCEERLDVIVFNNTPLCREILKRKFTSAKLTNTLIILDKVSFLGFLCSN